MYDTIFEVFENRKTYACIEELLFLFILFWHRVVAMSSPGMAAANAFYG
tara:strand:- start:835 stop:981 length:147 start_codon:yes stop_codon:yes gene_type:complete